MFVVTFFIYVILTRRHLTIFEVGHHNGEWCALPQPQYAKAMGTAKYLST